MISISMREVLLANHPGKSTFVVTRSNFVGAGALVGKWLGNNFSLPDHYQCSIAGILAFASIHQVPWCEVMSAGEVCSLLHVSYLKLIRHPL